MDIKGYRPDPIPPGTPQPAQPVRERQDTPAQETADRSRARREDRVEISADARRAAEAAEAAESAVPEGTLPPDRLVELRRRIQARAHDSPEVIDEVLRRMIESGDL
jgi:hypothetical protein